MSKLYNSEKEPKKIKKHPLPKKTPTPQKQTNNKNLNKTNKQKTNQPNSSQVLKYSLFI